MKKTFTDCLYTEPILTIRCEKLNEQNFSKLKNQILKKLLHIVRYLCNGVSESMPVNRQHLQWRFPRFPQLVAVSAVLSKGNDVRRP